MDPSPPECMARRLSRLLGESLFAGLVLGAADWLAAGVARMPGRIVVVVLAAGLLAGLAAGIVAALVRREGVALGLVVGGATLFHAASTFSKEIDRTLSPAVRLPAIAALVVLAVLAGWVAARQAARRPRSGTAWPA
ncbi:MAG: hypothetical protein AB1726_14045, partial [Planctomycetota bacterium]